MVEGLVGREGRRKEDGERRKRRESGGSEGRCRIDRREGREDGRGRGEGGLRRV